MNLKKRPNMRQYAPLFRDLWTLSGAGAIIGPMVGFETEEAYLRETNVYNKMHLIKKPFFFLSALDDQMFGPRVIPID